MEEKKVSQQINDIVGDNVKKLAALFPSVVKDGEVDFDALREQLGQFKEVSSEKYELTWAGKKAAKKLAQEDVIGRTLKYYPEESVNTETTENLYIEGDNLEVLKLLRQNYYGAVKMIYIDPPYNTGNDFIYNDTFKMDENESELREGNVDEFNVRFTQNVATGNRYHANWLNMMYSRLLIAKDLLSEDGSIFISIDDHEADSLKKICDEIFGESCFVANVSWQRTYSIRNDSKGIPVEVEHLLIFSKFPNWEPNKLPRTEEMNESYSNPDADRCDWMSGSPVAPGAKTHQGMVYAIQHPFTGAMFYPSNGACWRYSQDQMLDYMNGWCPYVLKDINDDTERAKVCGISAEEVKKGVKAIVLEKDVAESKMIAEEVYKNGPWPRFYFTNGGLGGVRRKVYLDSVGGKIATNFWKFEDVGHTDEAKKELKNLFGGRAPFDTPKPVRLLERIMTIATDEDSIVLDFFSGSASTAHAVISKNIEDIGHRRFIMVQAPELSVNPEYPTLCEIGKERIRLAGKHVLEKNLDIKVDVGFKVFKVSDTNIKWNSLVTAGQLNLNQIETTPDNIDFMPETKDIDVVYEVMLRQRDVHLSESIELLDDIGSRTYLYATSYLICLESIVTNKMIDRIAAIDPVPVKFIFRDSAFRDDIALKDETFRRLKAVVEKNSGGAKTTYTVEFI